MAIFCTYCGRVLKEGEICQCRQGNQPDNGQPMGWQNQQPYGQPMGQQYQQQNNGQPMGGQQYQQPYGQVYGQPIGVLPMRWYNFVIYVQMFLAALCLVSTSIMVLTGANYGKNANWIYTNRSSMRTIDMVYGISLIGMAIIAIIIRQGLAGYKRKALTMYYAFPIIQLVITTIYTVFAYKNITFTYREWSDCLGYIFTEVGGSFIIVGVIEVIFIILNKTYFDKRIHLFVN